MIAKATQETVKPYYPPAPPHVLKRRQELVATIEQYEATEAERKTPLKLSAVRALEIALLKTKAANARKELLRTVPERLRLRRSHLIDNIEALAKRIPSKRRDIESSLKAVQFYREQGEKGPIASNIRADKQEAWVKGLIDKAKAAAARADQRRAELPAMEREYRCLQKELERLEEKMVAAAWPGD